MRGAHYISRFTKLTPGTKRGTGVIQVEVKETGVRLIRVNAVDLQIASASFESKASSEVAKRLEATIEFAEKNETVEFLFKEDLPAGPGKLHVEFTGELNDKMKGFYRTKYTKDGKDAYHAVTQFEATDAR